MKKHIFFIVSCCLVANFAMAQSKIIKKINLETIEKKRFDYMVKGDVKKLSIYIDSSLHYIHSNGEVHDYSTFLNSIESKSIEYTYYEFKNSSYKLFGKIAIGTGDLLVKGNYKGTPFEVNIRFTSINKKKKHSWQLIHWQSTKINP